MGNKPNNGKKEVQNNKKDNKEKQNLEKNPVNNSHNIQNIPKKKFENYELKTEVKVDRCITCLAILRNNKLMAILKSGIIKIFEFYEEKDKNNIGLKEIIHIEEEEIYCFNYGIELDNGDLAVASEDEVLKIIKIYLDDDDKKELEKLGKKQDYLVIQEMTIKDEPIYIIKQLTNGELVLGCWLYIHILGKVNNNKYEIINKVLINQRTFSLIELSPGEILSSQCYAKTLTLNNLANLEYSIINNIESNENPNIICKYKNKNEIIFVAYDKGISIVSIIKKSLIQKIETSEIISSIIPIYIKIFKIIPKELIESNPYLKHIKGNNIETEYFCLLCGVKKRVFGGPTNYKYNFNIYEFNLDNNKENENNKNIGNKIIEIESVHLNEIKAIENTICCKNNILNIKKEEQIIISMGTEDKKLKIWKIGSKII